MFIRTARLTLRPGWPEDAPALCAAIADRGIVKMLARAPWPYGPVDAAAFLAQPARAGEPNFLIFEHVDRAVRLIGSIGVHRDDAGALELGYWLRRDAWGRGYATEAGAAVLDTLRASLRIERIGSGRFIDNPASGRVLAKLGFVPTGAVEPRWSRARGVAVPCVLYESRTPSPLPLAGGVGGGLVEAAA
ncbi:GNAT family N-acetyltransferase [Sphingomonas qomolangmaensis]|uniref:GNAT family N-acetyltransferase n=1 Tax=Sphingomonas qomolangmaensis TaxID=2918765 RepID=A0ABY5LDX1_9SPHN|nr:GNAT family N-acetyltransferase [Sphingomonas qomolangmaensis]UUL84086.1 GNAT family N-acetyltransferase [Sphingomonas qomolangmaensis]